MGEGQSLKSNGLLGSSILGLFCFEMLSIKVKENFRDACLCEVKTQAVTHTCTQKQIILSGVCL